jgi:hypothetical protein
VVVMTTRRALKGTPRIPLRQISPENDEVRQVQQYVTQATEKARAYQPTKGKVVTVTSAGAGDVDFAHTLGFKPTQFRKVADRSTGGPVDFTHVSSDSRITTLTFSGAGEVDIEVC